jgi:hypothetical protein
MKNNKNSPNKLLGEAVFRSSKCMKGYFYNLITHRQNL